MITLNIHKSLKKYFKNQSSVKVNCHDYFDLISYMVSNYPEFSKLVKNLKNGKFDEELFLLNNKKKLINNEDIYVNKKLSQNTFYLVPSLSGGKSGFVTVAIGIGIVALAIFAAPAVVGAAGPTLGMATPAIAGITYGQIAAFGVSVALSGIMAAMAKAPSAPARRQFTDAGSRTDNNAFDGLRNNITSNVPIGLNYGLNRVAGQMISGYILSRNHGKNDVVNVSESF